MLNIEHIIQSGGLLLIGFIVFAETAFLLGFFLPGDTLLFTAGFFAAQGKLPIAWLIFVIFIAAVLGDNAGYEIGKHGGKRLFKKKDSKFFRHDYIEKAEVFYEKHGGKTIILARYIPIVRTFAPLVAGIGRMDRKKFMIYNIVGAFFWAVSVTLLGYWLGSKIPDIDKYLLPVVLIAVIFTFSPPLFHVWRDSRGSKENKKTQ